MKVSNVVGPKIEQWEKASLTQTYLEERPFSKI